MRYLCLVLIGLALCAGCSKSRHVKSPPTKSPQTMATSLQPQNEPIVAPLAKDAPAVESGPVVEPISDKGWSVSGFGDTPENARINALREAGDAVRRKLKEQHPDLDRELTPAYLTDNKIAEVGEAKQVTRENNQKAYEVDVQLQLKPEHLEELSTLARNARMGPRQHVVLFVLFGLCGVLAVGGLYLRLENATRGYSTGLLRLAAAVVLAAVGGAMFLLW